MAARTAGLVRRDLGGTGTVPAGLFALLLLPIVLPPLALLLVQACQATRLLRGRSTPRGRSSSRHASGGPARGGSRRGGPGQMSSPPAINDVPGGVVLGVGALAVAAAVQATAAALLLPGARHRATRLSRLVCSALACLAVAQLAALTLAGSAG